MYVAIIIPHPLEARSTIPLATTGPYVGDNFPFDGKPQNPLKVDAPAKRHLQQDRTTAEEPPSVKQKTTHQTNETIAPEPAAGRDEPQASKKIDARTLRQQPQVLIASLLEPSAFAIGTRIGLDETDVLHVKTGGIAMIYVRYRVEKLVKGAENQDARTA